MIPPHLITPAATKTCNAYVSTQKFRVALGEESNIFAQASPASLYSTHEGGDIISAPLSRHRFKLFLNSFGLGGLRCFFRVAVQKSIGFSSGTTSTLRNDTASCGTFSQEFFPSHSLTSRTCHKGTPTSIYDDAHSASC